MSKNTFVQIYIYIYIYNMNSPKYKIDDLRQRKNYFLFFVPVSLNERIIVPVLTYVDRAWPDVGRGLWRWWLDVMRVSSIPSKKKEQTTKKRIVWVETWSPQINFPIFSIPCSSFEAIFSGNSFTSTTFYPLTLQHIPANDASTLSPQ